MLFAPDALHTSIVPPFPAAAAVGRVTLNADAALQRYIVPATAGAGSAVISVPPVVVVPPPPPPTSDVSAVVSEIKYGMPSDFT